QEVADPGSLQRHDVMNDRGRLVDERGTGQHSRAADAKLGLLAAERQSPAATHAVQEAADRCEHRASEGHVAADEVTDCRASFGQATVAAADHPKKLVWKPGRL